MDIGDGRESEVDMAKLSDKQREVKQETTMSYTLEQMDNAWSDDARIAMARVNKLEADNKHLREVLEWLVNLANNVGKAGDEPTPNEWDDAWYSAFKALGGDKPVSQEPT